jgi:hypothetical protein
LKLTVAGVSFSPKIWKVSMIGTFSADREARPPFFWMLTAPGGSPTVQKSPEGRMPPL